MRLLTEKAWGYRPTVHLTGTWLKSDRCIPKPELSWFRSTLDFGKNGDARANLAVQVFAGSVRRFIGAYAAELGGLDLLIFTGGIGERSQFMRDLICQGLEFLGIERDGMGQASKTMVMASEEEIQIARHSRRLLRMTSSSA